MNCRHRLTASVLAIALLGCNTARVVRSNFERTVQNKGQPKPSAWPAHPSEPPVSGLTADEQVGVQPTPGDEPDEDQIIQAVAQRPYAPTGSGSITGRVIDAAGRPQALVSVIASPTRRPGGRRMETVTDIHGNFSLRGLEPGQRYLILASATKSPVPLIGRVAAVAPQRGITIGLSRPQTADSRAEPPVSRQELQEHFGPERGRRETTAGTRLHASDPFARSNGTPAIPPSGLARSQPKQTREQVVASNRLNPPWDMPGPPRRRTAPANTTASPGPPPTRKPDPGRSAAANDWRQAGSAGGPDKQNSPNATFSKLDAPPHRSESRQDPHSESDDESRNGDPWDSRRPPIEIDADAKPDRPRATVTTAKGPNEPTTAELAVVPPQPTATLHDRPMCEMDGKRLVDFQLNDVDGRPVSFSSLNSRLVLIDFWTTWCSPCLRAIPQLVSLQKRYGAQGLQIVGIACEQGDGNDRRAHVAKIRNQLHVSYPLLIDEGDDKSLVRDHFGVISYPTLILVDRSGKVLWRCEGAADQADMVHLENLLKTRLNSPATRYN